MSFSARVLRDLLLWGMLLSCTLSAQRMHSTLRSEHQESRVRTWNFADGPEGQFILVVVVDHTRAAALPPVPVTHWETLRDLLISESRSDEKVQCISSVDKDLTTYCFMGYEARWRDVVRVAGQVLADRGDSSLINASFDSGAIVPEVATPGISRGAALMGDDNSLSPKTLYDLSYCDETVTVVWSGSCAITDCTEQINMSFAGLPRAASDLADNSRGQAIRSRGEVDVPSGQSVYGFHVFPRTSEDYATLLLLREAWEKTLETDAAQRGAPSDSTEVKLDSNEGVWVLYAREWSLSQDEERTAEGRLSSALAAARGLPQEQFLALQKELLLQYHPDSVTGICALSREGVRLSRATEGQAIDLRSSLQALTNLEYRRIAGSQTVDHHRFLGKVHGPSESLVATLVSLLCLLLIVIALFMLLRRVRWASTSAPRRVFKLPVQKDVDVLIQEIQGWYLKQDRLKEHRDPGD